LFALFCAALLAINGQMMDSDQMFPEMMELDQMFLEISKY